MKRTPRAGHSNLPVPKTSKGSPGNAKSTLSKGGPHTRSAEDIPRRVQLSVAGGPPSPQRRAISPGTPQRRSLLPSPVPGQNGQQSGVRYITEDLIRKICKEDSLEMVTTLNLTLTKAEAGKKIKYIENLDRLKRLQVLILSNNIIERIEKLDKLLKLKELDLSSNCIVKIEGLENLTNLQILNLSGNLIEHIPIWMGKRLKSLRAFHVGRNRLESLSELAKLKPLPDLTQLTVAENPLAEFNHCRPYLVFHLRTLEVIDGQAVTDRERSAAKDRFEQDELERLEKQLEGEEAKYRRLEEDHNRSKQERSHMSATEDDLRKREKNYNARIEELERELETKNDLLKKKTSELNKACEKHYQLEQDLAFHKIDSKFDSLGRGPEQSYDDTGDDSGLLGESPYIGKARYKANRLAGETEIPGASPNRVQIHSVPGPVRADVKMELNNKLDHEIAVKQDKVSKANSGVKEAEDRLKRLTNDLAVTENKLKNATKDLKNIGDSALTEKEEQKQNIRQKMTRKMRHVNEMKDSATQIEEELEKTKTSMHKHKMDLARMKDQISRMDNTDPNYRRVYADMVDKEQQINESNQMYGQLQEQLELMLDTVAKETNDIKKLEQQLNEDTLETNESLREELDEIVGGLQTYLAQVQTKAAKKEKEFDQLLKENEAISDRCRKLENELSVVDQEANSLRDLERRYMEMEQSFRQQEDRNREMEEQIHRSQRQDLNTQDKLENRELENASLKKALKDLEQKAKEGEFVAKNISHNLHSTPVTSPNGDFIQKKTTSISETIPGIIPHDKVAEMFPQLKNEEAMRKRLEQEKQTLEKQLQTEKAKAIEGERKSKEAQRKDDEVRKLMSQLETAKAQNVALRDRVEQDTQTLQARVQESTSNADLKRRLKDLSQSLKQNRVSIEPEGDRDFVGKTFKDLQGFVQDRMNKSTQDLDTTRVRLDKSDHENQSLREQMKRLQDKLNKRDEKVKNEKNKSKEEKKADAEEIKRLNDENNRLRNALKEAKNRSKQGKGSTKIVHDQETDSVFSRRSSLNSEEKHLFDELQNELMSLKRIMRSKEDDANKKLLDAEAEAAMLEQNLQDKEESYQNEIERLREHMEMQRERQEARVQVIAADLDQATQVADFLQRTLDEREAQLHGEVQQSDMNNQMITTQEDELAKLYDILEAQRQEVDRLNGMLDTISGQGGSLGTSGADEELWRLRQEVNNLKETLAMQSAYVQTMPPPQTSAGVQASTGTGTQYYLTDHGQAAGPTYRPLLSQYREQPLSMVPPVPGMTSMGTNYAPPGFGRSMGVGVGVGVGSGGSPQGAGSPVQGTSPGGTDQREARTPPGGRPAGRSRPSQSTLKRHADRGADAEGDGHSERSRSGRSSRSRRKERGRDRERGSNRGHERDGSRDREMGRDRSRETERKIGFEPVHRPQPYHPQMSSGPVNTFSTPEGAIQPGGMVPASAQMDGYPAGQMTGPGVIGPASMGHSQVPFGAPSGIAPSAYQSSNLSPTRGQLLGQPLAQSGMPQPAGPQPSILKHPGIQPGSGPAGTAPQGYMIPPGYTIPPPPGQYQGSGASVPAAAPRYSGSQAPAYGASQTQSVGSTQTPGHAGNQTAFAPLPTHPHGPAVALGQTPGVQVGGSAFTAPAQTLAYNSDRVFLPAYPTSPSRPAGRVYYNRGGGGGGGGGGGPPLPPQGTGYSRDRSPDQNVRFLPMEPLAQGTPIAGHSMPRTGGAGVNMPSPIRPVLRDQSPRRMAQTAGANDDTYLFCNVPEHHDLEDYIAELQEKLKKLKARIANEKELQAAVQDENDYNLIRRLRGELLERRDELEGLDLAIERQQKNLKNLKAEEKQLHFERQSAKEELEFMRDQNAKRKRKVRVYPDDEDSFDERMENSRKKMIKDEIRCLEQTLAKRKAQLREADRLLKECNTDLKCAREEARETVREYDKASLGLESTVKETSELEKRANVAGVELIKASEKLSAIRREIKDSESRRSKQERLLKDVTQLITKRDADFKDLDSRSRMTQQNLSKLQSELNAATQKERETVQALRDSEDILAKRRNEIARMRDQIDQQKHELEKVDHMMGKKRTELQFLTDSLERKQAEINQLIRDTESELSSNKRELKEQRDLIRNLEVQKSDLSSQIKSKRTELQKIKDEIDTDDEILQKLVNTVNKHKSDLKHTFEMQRLEQTELDNLKSQHAQKLSELEKTQRELLDEKNALESYNSDVNKKSAELERFRGIIERDREEVERLAMEKQSYEDRISTMTREKEMLDETFKTLDTKVAHMRRSQNTMEEKIDSTSRRLETLEGELQRREREMDDMNREKAHMQKDMNNLKNSLKDGKNELKMYKEQIKDAEKSITHLEQQLRDTSLQRDEAKLEMERLNEGIRQSRITHDDCIRQQRQREEELQDLIRTMDEREIEYQETRKSLNKVRKEVEKEESKLQKLVSTANYQLDNIRTDLNTKQSELTVATADIMNLKKEAEKMELDEQKLSECEKQIRELKQEVQDRNEEKNELAKALTRSYEELQKLRTESAQEQERLTIERMQLENTLRDMQEQLEHAKKEIQQMQKRSSSQITELQALAEEQFNRANKLSDELTKLRAKKQTVTHDSQVTRPHDKGQYPITIVPENSKSSFRHYVDLPQGRDHSNFTAHDKYKTTDQSFTEQDLDISWPSGSPGSIRLSVSPVRRDSGARIKDPSKSPSSSRARPLRPLSASFRQENHSSTLPRETHFRSSYSRQRDRSWSPPGVRDRTPSPSRFRDKRLLPSPNKDFDSFSLPELPDRSATIDKDSFFPTATLVPATHTTAISTTAASVSMVTDSSSTLTSTLTTPPTTQRDQKESVAIESVPGIPALGLSPPVRDSGSSLTTVTTLTDQAALSSARDSGDTDRQRFSFDLGFLDILTIDSNSSVADQLSTGRTTDRLSEDKENIRIESVEEQRKSEILREKLSKEQELLRLQLQQQMQRHADAMEQARLQSEGTIENLRKKLNTLQDVLVTTSDITSPTLRRARSRSAGLLPSPDRQRSPSPGYHRHGYLAQRPRSRSRSADRITRSIYPERDILTV
ncbi:centriolin-like isoform X4 [Mercenaria mercenaria]|uniref:centriolin-like isoform X4 n=1 Tax=Mercenaria mercenaria TaxID=6596 RepID=UPI00234E5C07|nr:centriolin-like isoform X4 [Mercenaria mercenaria]